MAYERSSDAKIKGDSLDVFVSNLSKLYTGQLAIRNADDEARFNTAVLEDDLSLDDQLEYRKEQLKRVSDDPEEKKRVRKEISFLRDQIQQQEFTDAFSEKLQDFQSGLASIGSVISFLEGQLANTDDITLQNTINSKLAEAKAQEFSLTQGLIKNQTEYAMNSKSASIIDTQITRVNSEKSKALLAGNDQLVSVYDLQLQALQKTKADNQIQQDVLALGSATSTGAVGAVALLDALNAKIANSPSTGPVKIGDVTYANAKDFWTYKRDQYLSDSSSNGFFSSLASETKDKLAVANSKNLLTADGVKAAVSTFDTLPARPELAQYGTQISTYKQDALQNGANYLVNSATNEFARTLDVNKAVSEMGAIRSLGVNIDDAFTKILQSNAATKNSQVGNILAAAQNAMANDPNLTPEAAVRQAVAAGAGTVVSPNEAAGKTETEIAASAVKTAEGGTGANDQRTTVTPPAQPANTPNASGNISAATIAGLPNLTPGTRSEDVKTLQNYLIQQGFQIPSGATGLYGPETTAAVQALQEKFKVDNSTGIGYFGPRTKSALAGQQTQTTPAPAPTPTVVQPPQQQPVQQQTPTPAPAAPANTSYQTDPDYLKVKNGAGQAGKYGRTPGGIVDLSTGTILK